MILLEGSESAGMTTGEWWATQGIAYRGSLKDKPYYVYKDKTTGETSTGSVKFPGDPFTYEDLGDGRLRVMSGPNSASIGATFQKSSSSSNLKKSEESDLAGRESAQRQSIDEIIKAISKHLRLTALYLARSIAHASAMKHTCLEQKPTIFLSFANDLVKYTAANSEALEALFKQLQSLPQDKIINLAGIKIESPSPSMREASELVKGGLYVDYKESDFHLSRLKYLINALKSKGAFSWIDVGPDASDSFIMSLDIFMDAKRFLDSVAVRKAMIANVIAIDPEKGLFSTSIYGAGGAREILSFNGEEWTFDELKSEMTDLIKDVGDDH